MTDKHIDSSREVLPPSQPLFYEPFASYLGKRGQFEGEFSPLTPQQIAAHRQAFGEELADVVSPEIH